MEDKTNMNAAAEAAEGAATGGAESVPAAETGGAENTGPSPEQRPDDLDGPILPKGWTPEEDIFAGPSLKDLFPEEKERTEPVWQKAGETDGNAPETPAEEGSAETGADTAPLRETPGDGPEGGETPDYKAMYEALVQKGKDAEDMATYRRVYQEELDAGMSDRWARTAAANAVGGKTFPLTDEPGEGASDNGPDAVMAAVKQLQTIDPGLKEIPAEVGRMVKEGMDLVSAYGAWRAREDAKTIRELREKNQRLTQALGNTVKAPVRSVSGGGQHQEETDDFLRGFDKDY